jgi:hypothetical protein
VQFLVDRGHSWAEGRTPVEERYITFPLGTGRRLAVSFASGSRVRVEIHHPKDPDKRLFDELSEKSEEIEKRFPDERICWERDCGDTSRIAVYRGCDIIPPEHEACSELYAWIERNLIRFREILGLPTPPPTPMGKKTPWGSGVNTGAGALDIVILNIPKGREFAEAEIAEEVRRRGLTVRGAVREHLDNRRKKGFVVKTPNGWRRVSD